MRVNGSNLLYAMAHPLQAIRYLRHGDTISFQQISEFLPDNPVIIEAGADTGVHTELMSSVWPNSTIYAFEPVPAQYQKLQNRFRGRESQIKVFPFALGSLSEKKNFYVSGQTGATGTQSSSLLAPQQATVEYDFVPFHQENEIEVEVITLDDFFREHAPEVTQVDFMWLDLQGYESEAISGAMNMIKAVSAIHLEVSQIELYDGQPLYPEIKDQLRGLGFGARIEAIFRVGGNVLFVK